MKVREHPSLLASFVPLLVLVSLLATNVLLFGDNALGGASQMSLLFAAAVAVIISMLGGGKWDELFEGAVASISNALPALLILLMIGALAGTWLISGVVPAMIYYGLDVLNPTIFLFATCLICCIVSLSTGSSWTTVATVGVALMGIGHVLGFKDGLIAGAIISGAYFGDKMSPLSDTTNLAPAMAGTDIITHIKHMVWTTGPSITIALILYLIIGFVLGHVADVAGVEAMQSAISSKFNISPWLFLVPVVVIVLIVKRVPPVPALLAGAVLGGVFAVAFQGEIIQGLGARYKYSIDGLKDGESVSWGEAAPTSSRWYNLIPQEYSLHVLDSNQNKIESINIDLSDWTKAKYSTMGTGISFIAIRSPYAVSAYTATINAMTSKVAVKSDNAVMSELLTSKGMSGMLSTIWLIICAMTFGGVMEASGMLARITRFILTRASSTGSVIASTVGTCIVFNITAADQYLAIVVPGRMYAEEYRKRGLAPENLSRTLEDSGTVTSVLVPWNTGGAYNAGILGVATGSYLPYAFFNLISPLMSILFGYMGWKINPLKSSPEHDSDSHRNADL